MKKYEFIDPQITRREIAQLLIKSLERELTGQEINAIYWLGDADYETRGVILDLFKDMQKRIDYLNNEATKGGIQSG